MRTQVRVKGLQDAMNDLHTGQQSRMGALNKMAQLQREKERIVQERANWQEKIDLIDARLRQIEELEKQLQRLLVEEDHAPDEDRAGRRERSSRAIVHKAAPVNEVTTLRY